MALGLWVRTFLLLFILTAFLMFLGYLFGGIYLAGVMFAVALVINFAVYFFSDTLALRRYHARILNENEAPWLHEMVEDLARRAGIPKPRVAIAPIPTPNAFATGRNPEHAVVVVTDGILRLLNREELRAVLGHEITHIKNRDILIGTIAAAIAGAIMYFAYALRWAALIMMSDRDRNSWLIAIPLLLLSILAPIAALLIQMAISRSREYLADEGGARLSGNPGALASALMKLEHGVMRHPLEKGNPASAHMFIVNPFRSGIIARLFSTHPSTEKRIENLRRVAAEMGVPFQY